MHAIYSIIVLLKYTTISKPNEFLFINKVNISDKIQIFPIDTYVGFYKFIILILHGYPYYRFTNNLLWYNLSL